MEPNSIERRSKAEAKAPVHAAADVGHGGGDDPRQPETVTDKHYITQRAYWQRKAVVYRLQYNIPPPFSLVGPVKKFPPVQKFGFGPLPNQVTECKRGGAG